MTGRGALARGWFAVMVAAGAFACLGDQTTARSKPVLPDATNFRPVAQAFVHRCGSLDCHGQIGRNMRIFGNEGLRLAPGDVPLTPANTTDAEVAEDYTSIVSLEPETMGAVVSSGGADPERLTFMRKALGIEDHKGLQLVSPGDDWDVCVTSWLASATDTAACARAAPPP